PEGDRLAPTELTAGPWSPDAQHGGPVSALLARACEQVPAERAMQVVRLTVELVRPVPLTPLEVHAEITRPGKRVQLVDATLRTAGSGGRDGTEVARARALRIRTTPVPVPDQLPDPQAPAPPDVDGIPTPPAGLAAGMGYAAAVDLRHVTGSWEGLGPATVWIRLLADLVEGEVPSPFQRVAAAADFGNGLSRIVPFDTHTFLNPDLTIALSRIPAGSWIGLDAVTRLSPDGFGQAESTVFDTAGPVGRAVQSLIVERR
ncbi:MAG: thioesterase family protein, partial [Acidimicrobiales bacterium]